MKLLIPVPVGSLISQDYDGHVARAIANNLCYMPSPCPQKRWYYGGIDYVGPVGTKIKAAASGFVRDVRLEETGYGYHIRIQHPDGSLTIYAHLSDILINKGQEVSAGDLIGLMGNTGNSTGPHLHFELRVNGIPTDPAPYIVTELEPEAPPPEVEMPDFMAVPMVQVTAKPYLNIRNCPDKVLGTYQGYLLPGTIVDVVGFQRDSRGNIWLQIGYKQYIAMLYNGFKLAEWVKGGD